MRELRPGASAERLAEIVVLVVAVALAGFLFMKSLPLADQLWGNALHDRNGHYTFGLKLAIAARHLDVVAFLGELEKAKVWPPVHGLLLCAVLLVGGFDHRLGIVPSLVGWALTIVFSWKIAMRSFDDARSGVVAGTLSIALVATSPALALISSDVMLEGLGSGLSALCLWAFMAAHAEAEKLWRWRLLGIALTVLFFEKYNYWAFAIASLALTAWLIDQRVRALVPIAMRAVAPLALMLLRRRAFVAGLLFMGLAVAIALRGPTSLHLFGRDVSVYPPANIFTLACAMMFVATVQVWRKYRELVGEALGAPGRILLAWHILPVIVSLLLPHRLSAFVWFLGPSNMGSPTAMDFWSKLALYRQGLFESFFALSAIGWACLGLFILAVLFARKLRAEAIVVLVFVAVSALALLVHPQAQARFLSTTVFALFVGAGDGLAILTGLLLPRSTALRLATGVAISLTVFAAQWWLPYPDIAYRTTIRNLSGPSDLDLMRLYAPFVRQGEDLAVAATFGPSSVLSWPILEACKCAPKIEEAPFDAGYSREQTVAAATTWLETIRASQAVIADLPGYPDYVYHHQNTIGIVDAIALQSRFRIVREIRDDALNARILILARP